MNTKGGFTDIFIFMIFAFIIVVIIGVFIFIGGTAYDRLQSTLGTMDVGDGNNNASVVIDNTIGKTNTSIGILRWAGILIIFGMIVGMFIGSYMVTTKPVFFIPFFFLQIIGIVVAVGIANAYEILITDPTMTSTFATMSGLNWIILKLPIVTIVVGLASGVIMFSRLGKREEQFYGYQ